MFSEYYNIKIKAYLNKILLILLILFCISISKSFAENHKEVKVGILLGFTGLVESLTPSMADSAELAFNEISDDYELQKQIKFKLQRGDTNCTNNKFAKDTATQLVNDGIVAVIGAACPNITMEIAKNILVPKKIMMVSPADTSNELIQLKDI